MGRRFFHPLATQNRWKIWIDKLPLDGLSMPPRGSALAQDFYQLLILIRHFAEMPNRNSPLNADIWLNDMFMSKAVQQGAVIRRKARDIERFAAMGPFMREIERRGFQVVENSGQIIVFCNREPVRWLTGKAPHSSKE